MPLTINRWHALLGCSGRVASCLSECDQCLAMLDFCIVCMRCNGSVQPIHLIHFVLMSKPVRYKSVWYAAFMNCIRRYLAANNFKQQQKRHRRIESQRQRMRRASSRARRGGELFQAMLLPTLMITYSTQSIKESSSANERPRKPDRPPHLIGSKPIACHKSGDRSNDGRTCLGGCSGRLWVRCGGERVGVHQIG
jgi:hypothetical protein